MDHAQLATLIGGEFIRNWQYFLAGFVTTLAGTISLTWYVANLINGKKIEILEIRLSNQRDNFEQYQAVVEQRILTIQEEAERLRVSYQEKGDPNISAPSNVGARAESKQAIDEEIEGLDIPAFLRRTSTDEGGSAPNRYNSLPLVTFVERTDNISEIIEGALKHIL